MPTYQYTAFRDERFAAHGDVKADSPEDAKAKILERFYQEGLNFYDFVDGGEPDHFMLTDEAGAEFHIEDATPTDVWQALKDLIRASDNLHAGIEGTTGLFEREAAALSEATSAAEKILLLAGSAA
ncbi:hypothetical protein [Rhizobium ruizarguesonis]|uniref:hypothetical protein n=1 Tax=Rhizobium ruizarguesonis TaxID=2081791 RepID=UPI0010301087|nr:hypothetical protein [Rhizobium ruizarguesonis]MBY5891495.1 hypothetical protein [Rhizobium leguminosarum]QSZ04580.1 hypothetical protein J3P73_28695 [Rhizobium ruizarguesonis]TBA11052.1 hypothetical protein ELH65_31820 [Rhizobium ruizarguesonis]